MNESSSDDDNDTAGGQKDNQPPTEKTKESTQSKSDEPEESKTSPKEVFVDPNAVIYPTPKSDGAILLKASADAAGMQDGSTDNDLENFTDINS